MSVVKTSSRFGKKQATTTAARRPASKTSTKNAKTAVKPNAGKSHKSNGKPAAKYSSLKSKQMAVESAKRSIWSSVQKITDALITNASSGNLSTAKELFDFAGVYSLAETDEDNAAAAVAPVPAKVPEPAVAEAPKVHPIDIFLNKIGVEPSTALPEPDAA